MQSNPPANVGDGLVEIFVRCGGPDANCHERRLHAEHVQQATLPHASRRRPAASSVPSSDASRSSREQPTTSARKLPSASSTMARRAGGCWTASQSAAPGSARGTPLPEAAIPSLLELYRHDEEHPFTSKKGKLSHPAPLDHVG